MRETQAPSLIWEDRTCHGATKPTHHNDWACALGPRSCNCWAHVLQLPKPAHPRAHPLQWEKPPQWEACSPRLERRPWLPQLEKRSHGNEASPPVLFSLFNRPTPFHTWPFASYSLIVQWAVWNFCYFLNLTNRPGETVVSCKLTAANSGDLKLRF